MIDPRLLKVFHAMQENGVACLLMGGQACVIYGAAEFSKDIDFAILADSGNLEKLRLAMDSLDAEVIAVPPFEASFLEEGLAVHFRCRGEGMAGLRVDVMSRMRNVDDFATLWRRRRAFSDGRGGKVNLMELGDLVQAKKTQRDKDWPMIQRLLEVDYLSWRDEATPEKVNFWLKEMRTPELLIELVERYPEAAKMATSERPLLEEARKKFVSGVEESLAREMLAEKKRDREYWAPLKAMLGELRREAREGQRD